MTLSGPVLVATDLSEAADEALRQGDALARGLGTRLHVCHVLPSNFEVHVLFPQHAGSNLQVLAELATRPARPYTSASTPPSGGSCPTMTS